MALQPASEGGKGGVMKYFVPGHLLGSSRPEMEKCSVMPLVFVQGCLMISDMSASNMQHLLS